VSAPLMVWPKAMVGVFSHSDPIKLAVAYYLGMPLDLFQRLHIQTASVTVLRVAPILGPTVSNYLTRYLGRRVVPTLMGYDPLMQFVHEVDALAAFKLAVMRDCPGVYNIAGDGVLPLSKVVELAGRIARPRARVVVVGRVPMDGPAGLRGPEPAWVRAGWPRGRTRAGGRRTRPACGRTGAGSTATWARPTPTSACRTSRRADR